MDGGDRRRAAPAGARHSLPAPYEAAARGRRPRPLPLVRSGRRPWPSSAAATTTSSPLPPLPGIEAIAYLTRPLRRWLRWLLRCFVPWVHLVRAVLVAERTQKWLIHLGTACVLLGVALGSAAASYGLFYAYYVPDLSYDIPVYLQKKPIAPPPLPQDGPDGFLMGGGTPLWDHVYNDRDHDQGLLVARVNMTAPPIPHLQMSPPATALREGALVAVASAAAGGLTGAAAPDRSPHGRYSRPLEPEPVETWQGVLTAEQLYTIGVELVVPETAHNLDLGNFMIEVTLRDAQHATILSRARPASLIYKTPLLRSLSTVMRVLPLAMGYAREAQTIRIPIIEDFEEDPDRPCYSAIVRISTSRLHFYECKLYAHAFFQGLRYFMYHWRWTTTLVLMSLFLVWEAVLLYAVWKVILSFVHPRSPRRHRDGGDDDPAASKPPRLIDSASASTTSASPSGIRTAHRRRRASAASSASAASVAADAAPPSRRRRRPTWSGDHDSSRNEAHGRPADAHRPRPADLSRSAIRRPTRRRDGDAARNAAFATPAPIVPPPVADAVDSLDARDGRERTPRRRPARPPPAGREPSAGDARPWATPGALPGLSPSPTVPGAPRPRVSGEASDAEAASPLLFSNLPPPSGAVMMGAMAMATPPLALAMAMGPSPWADVDERNDADDANDHVTATRRRRDAP
ncbi:hypothetical protein CXG81DRAFT_24754 [Caulochytrium protostelioides]|uniref:Seipin n=1 Tax=Caulochytrium protostelioides TaxID=1555241 RepID=A0A4P9XB65_9FUNG|nr:hypothetical protein CXG81DRAFT_24754 [Caulochytrium protostelioides]|eukprot:RKP02612.1 hypothetical protein CXG81DRAFT_24754 [Caulochytrium protostelioides]